MVEQLKLLDSLRSFVAWFEDLQNKIMSNQAVAYQDECYFFSYVVPQGMVKQDDNMDMRKQYYRGNKIDFEKFDLRSIFLSEANVQFNGDASKVESRTFVGNVDEACEVFDTYSELEGFFVIPENTLINKELNRLHALVIETSYFLAKKNNFEYSYRDWSDLDKGVYIRILEALLVILMYQDMKKFFVFAEMLSEGVHQHLGQYAFEISQSENVTKIDPSILVAASVFLSRDDIFANRMDYLFDTLSSDLFDDEDEDEDDKD